ncbi:penicillin-binding protein 1C [Desulfonema ishimotonii]|uniref:peptidoglycan glycosyltransferase n=1 Tax=Desulfonema ishimotonii TaxID=45657 RepID=A0A401FWK3_9BACT|nr:penicillin-binding protein 1C [Desulfonema ishimotonii]
MCLYAITIFLSLDAGLPLSLPEARKSFAVTVVADDGSPLRSFPDAGGVWRYPVTPDQVSPLYIDALLNYEDHHFWRHPGINPLSMIRAFIQFLQAGRPLSGGSTITMQVARILHPHPRNIPGKLMQMFRALQLEHHFSKTEILTFYLNYAPFGGPVEGVQAASFAYLGKPAKELSHAEAALLAVLPQAPTRFRPDRHPRRATRARNKVLDRMAKFDIWDRKTVADAKIETVMPRFDPRPMMAPLLARRLKNRARPDGPVRTFIDPFLQITVADLIRGFTASTPDHTSAAALVVENSTLAVRAYVGSADFLDNSRFGHVDMVQALRSPGSTLKPFLYGIAMEEGLIHSESLMVDAPFSFSGYRPDNFTRHFTGPVGAAEALQRSLNLPAVDLLDRVGPKYFDTRLRQGGLKLRYPTHQGPNLTMILGGVGASLEELVSAYTALARNGLAGKLRLTKDQPIRERYMLSPGAACIIRQILQENRRPDLPAGRLSLDRSRQVAWKTGTSYGFRDAWTIGVTDRYTVGIWVGRPDGAPSPGQYGRATAAPLLFHIVDSLPRQYGPSPPVPDSVDRAEICWPLGTRPTGNDDPLCHKRRRAWTLNHVIPPTLPDRADRHWQPNPLTVWVNPETGLRVEPDCPVPDPHKKIIARWPRAAEPWLSPRLRRKSRIPRLDPVCGRPVSDSADTIRIMGVAPDTVFRPPGASTRLPTLTLEAQGGRGELYWLLNGDLIARSPVGSTRLYPFTRTGHYHLTVMDLAGNYDSVEFVVIGGGRPGERMTLPIPVNLRPPKFGLRA